MAQQGGQCMAADGDDAGWHAERSRTCDPLRQHGDEEMGRELCFHGPIRLCCGLTMLGSLCPPHVFGDQDGPNTRQARNFPDPVFSSQKRRNGPRLRPASRRRVFPVCFCRHHGDPAGGIVVGENESLRMDVVRSSLDYLLLYSRSVHHLGKVFLQKLIIDYAGRFVIHLSSGVAGFTAAFWVGPRLSHDRQHLFSTQ
ncbi:hypothetical protein SLA2020_135040 [Shorea laevis]